MSNLIAYIPVLNQRHVDWFRKHERSDLFLISQEMAESLLPRLARNVGALSTEMMTYCIRAPHLVESVSIFDPSFFPFIKGNHILADEDVSYRLLDKYDIGTSCEFEDIRARYDMTAVKRRSLVVEGVSVTNDLVHSSRMEIARRIAPKSPDYWRQIGATLFVNGVCVSTACNNHYPTEYVTDIMGDPRMNVDAGQIGKYVSFHSEKSVIVECARKGIRTEGASLYSTVFPCEDCARAIVLAGVDHVFFEEGYSTLDAKEVLEGAGVKIVQVR